MTAVINHKSKRNKQVDVFTALLLDSFPPGTATIRDIFANGMYAREMTIAKDQWVASKIHKTEFIFTVSKGALLVSMDNNEEILIEAPFTGISKPGARRVAFVVEDTIWTTYHANPDNETVEQIEERIIEKHDNILLTEEMKNRMLSGLKKVESLTY